MQRPMILKNNHQGQIFEFPSFVNRYNDHYLRQACLCLHLTIFEFKRPNRDDFVNSGSKEDPIAQVTRYTNSIRAGKYKTPAGRPINVTNETPFYGYVVCDLTPKVREWLFSVQNFKPMPDGLGYFRWNDNINLYMEVLSWEKILKDSEMRNGIFFQKLGI